MDVLRGKKLILASKSPRRRELLDQLGLLFEVRTKSVVENFSSGLTVQEIPAFLARKKAEAMRSEINEDEIVIAADTIVTMNNEVFGKPRNEKNAKEILSQLSGKTHSVISGVCLLSQKKTINFSSSTKVWFKELKKEEINFYIKNFKTLDKAGAYAIQEWIGMIGIEKIEGDYFNVVGLPISRLWDELKAFCF